MEDSQVLLRDGDLLPARLFTCEVLLLPLAALAEAARREAGGLVVMSIKS